jgi:mannitol/fructose-specific phosphotransferase system IIA component (Ntr-type)
MEREQRHVVPGRVREVHAVERNNALRAEQPTFTFGAPMRLREFFSEDANKLELESTSKDAVLKELVSLLKLDEKAQAMLFKMLKRRETLGSTGIGQQIAIPHCRSLVVTRLRCAFGRSLKGIDFKAIDDKPVLYFSRLLPARKPRISIPVLGKIAHAGTRRHTTGEAHNIGGPRATGRKTFAAARLAFLNCGAPTSSR